MTTTVIEETVQSNFNKADPTDTADLLSHIQAGYAFSNVKAVVTAIPAAAAQDVTSDIVRANAVLTGFSPALPVSTNLPAVGAIVSVNVTAGTAATGARIIGDDAATPSATVCTIADDGKVITFEADVTAFTIAYQPRANGMADSFPQAAP